MELFYEFCHKRQNGNTLQTQPINESNNIDPDFFVANFCYFLGASEQALDHFEDFGLVRFIDKDGKENTGTLVDLILKAQNSKEYLKSLGIDMTEYSGGTIILKGKNFSTSLFVKDIPNPDSDKTNYVNGITYYVDDEGNKTPIDVYLDSVEYAECITRVEYKDKDGNVKEVRDVVDWKKAEKILEEEISDLQAKLDALYKEMEGKDWEDYPDKKKEAIEIQKELEKEKALLDAVKKTHTSSGGGYTAPSITYIDFNPSMVVPSLSGVLTLTINLQQLQGIGKSDNIKLSNNIKSKLSLFGINTIYALDYGSEFVEFYTDYTCVFPGETIKLYVKSLSTDMESFTPKSWSFWDGSSMDRTESGQQPLFKSISPTQIGTARDNEDHLIRIYSYTLPSNLKINATPCFTINFVNGNNKFSKRIDLKVIDNTVPDDVISSIRIRVYNESNKVYYDQQIKGNELQNKNIQEIKINFENMTEIREFLFSPTPVHVKVECFNIRREIIYEAEIEDLMAWIYPQWNPLSIQVPNEEWIKPYKHICSLLSEPLYELSPGFNQCFADFLTKSLNYKFLHL